MSTKEQFKDALEIPENVQVELENHTIKVKGEKGELQKKLLLPKIKMKKEDKIISFKSKYNSKKEKRIVNTHKSIILSMFKGVTEGFVYKLKACSGHFPMTLEAKEKELTIKNFFGEKVPRKAKIPDGVKVIINGDEITLEGADKAVVGQAAANIETATKIKRRDRRIFQDGIWIIEKAGKPIR